ncbi:MAG: epsH 1 [Frankiales bacterium]|nr:epsH 1 [Frankiales bacterium]
MSIGNPEVTVVVPVAGDRGQLAGTLAALLRQEHASFEVVVVDNGDNDLSPVVADLRHASDPTGRVRLVREPRPGSYAARNAGVLAGRGAVLAFTDADCRPRPDWLTRGTAALAAADGPAFVGGRVAMVRESRRRPTAPELYELVTAFPQAAYVAQGFAVTANLLVPRDVFDGVGPFDSTLRSGGDRDWGLRATAAGVSGQYGDDVVVEHPCRSSLRELHRKTVRTTTGHDAMRRARGLPPLDRAELGHLLRPGVRRTLRQARALTGTLDGLRFAGVAAYVHAVEVGTRLALARRR